MTRFKALSPLALIAVFCAAAFAAEAASGVARLNGKYAITGSGACLYAPGGFAGNLTPIYPTLSYSGSGGFSGTFVFDGAGDGRMNLFEVGITPPPLPSGTVPAAAQVRIAGPFSYRIAGGRITVHAANLQEVALAGPDAGATGQIDVLAIKGLLAADNKSLTLASAQPGVLTTTFSNGAVLPGICWYSFVLLQ